MFVTKESRQLRPGKEEPQTAVDFGFFFFFSVGKGGDRAGFILFGYCGLSDDEGEDRVTSC